MLERKLYFKSYFHSPLEVNFVDGIQYKITFLTKNRQNEKPVLKHRTDFILFILSFLSRPLIMQDSHFCSVVLIKYALF